ncbi:hypothetical protein SHIRM173S_02574 [Streptomyces hirsutus]
MPRRRRPKATFSKMLKVREEGVGLEDGVHRPLVRQRGDVLVAETDGAGGGFLQAGDHPTQRVVVLPQPDAPSSAKKEPSGTVRSRGWTAVNEP